MTVPTSQTRRQPRRVAAATFVGTAVEFYDFYIYGNAAALIFGKVFFPDLDTATATILSFATLATGWIGRPLGGLVAGHFGDRVGRKGMLVLSLVLMGISTTAVGFLPTAAMIGAAAPILLVLCRILQGLAAGAEYGGAVVMALEHSDPNHRARNASIPNAGVIFGLVLGTAVFYPITLLPQDQLMTWGWRIPFLISFIPVLIGLAIRMRVTESPEYLRVADAGKPQRPPVIDVLRSHWRQVLVVVGAHMAPNIWGYTMTVLILSYATTYAGYSRSALLLAVTIGAVVETLTIPWFGSLADRYGQRPVYIAGLVGMAVWAFPFFLIVREGSVPLLILGLVVALGVVHASVYGAQASYFAELFPTSVRYTGLSLGYQTAGALFGATLPALGLIMIAWNHEQPWYLTLYLVVAAAVSATVLILARTVRRYSDSTESMLNERQSDELPIASQT
ncbi:MFS transporter [Rhodococcus koreensis]|uniref:MFS transporter n=1 Tax=Rhodococcus koreensis TaxID=99653 RepID=UPI00197F09EA|nr:MFS transporter [Rhodococcus koreensis]QSE86070.1 MHS family MFS transporter [Rhodococcus koreensis]